jgi:hypothetical protein
MTAEADAAAGGEPNKRQQMPPQKLSKRQMREKGTEKNKWLVQHPKIQSMEMRNKLYVKDAGLTMTKAERENRAATIDPALDLMSPEVKFGRLLGGTDQRMRHSAVKKLKAYLKARCQVRVPEDGDETHSFVGGFSELDLLKLWKALWYTLYMADKKPVQDELSKHLAQLIWCVAGTEEDDEYAAQAYLDMMAEEEEEEENSDGDDPSVILEEIENTLDDDDDDNMKNSEESSEKDDESSGDDEDMDQHVETEDVCDDVDDAEVPHCRGAHLASLFTRTFFRTVRRDWDRMDKYRVDKFYTLIRLMMHEVYKYMALRHWHFGIIRLFNDAIFEEILNQKPNGLRYHLIDLSLEELAKVSAKSPLPLTEATFLDVLEPYLAMCQSGAGDDTIQARVMDNVLEKFLDVYSVVSDNALRQLKDESSDGSDEEKDNIGNCEDEGEDTQVILDQVHVETIAEFIFDLGSDPSTKAKYRKPLYEMHKKYMRRLKQIGRDVAIEEDKEFSKDGDMGIGEDEDVGFAQMSEEASDVEDTPEIHDVKPDSNPMTQQKTRAKKRKAERDVEEEERHDRHAELVCKDEKKKRKKNRHDGAKAVTKERKQRDVEEEVVISLSEQKEAKKVQKGKKQKKRDKKKHISDDIKNDGSSSKRVKFDKVNRSKSHKASMKALLTATPPKTKDVAPEKSILRNKGKHSPSVLSKKGRKKAVHYF